ncbi:hypothetical protein HZA26_04155 [Candidatus Nomurabacteria bacterium]|nr:hypothetical protein [Candidatus Nomurabacteria bacterium]
MDKLQWSALEYEERERGRDWFWALGTVIVATTLTSLIYGNYFFAVLIALGGILLGFFAIRKPEIVNYELNQDGLRIRNRVYLYKNIKSFWVRNSSEREGLGAMLFIKSERAFMPIISVHLIEDLADEIRMVMQSQNIREEEMREHASEKIMDYLGF